MKEGESGGYTIREIGRIPRKGTRKTQLKSEFRRGLQELREFSVLIADRLNTNFLQPSITIPQTGPCLHSPSPFVFVNSQVSVYRRCGWVMARVLERWRTMLANFIEKENAFCFLNKNCALGVGHTVHSKHILNKRGILSVTCGGK